MKVGDLIALETSSNSVNCNFIYHVKLPLYSVAMFLWIFMQNNSDLQKIYNTYRACLAEAVKQKIKIISFTDLSTPNFSIPKQYNAEVMIRSFIKFELIQEWFSFLDESKTSLEAIKFVCLDAATVWIHSSKYSSLRYSITSSINSSTNLNSPTWLQRETVNF